MTLPGRQRIRQFGLMLLVFAVLWGCSGFALTKSVQANQVAIAVTHAVISGQGCDAFGITNQLETINSAHSIQHTRWRAICLLDAGKRAAKSRKWEQSIAYLQAALQSDPLNLEAIRLLANDKYEDGDWNGALAVFRQAIESRPASDSWRVNAMRYDLGFLFLRAGRWQDAVAIYKEILDASPTDSMAHAYLGLAMYQGGAPLVDSIEQIQQAITLSPKHELGYRLLAQVYKGERRYADAEMMVRKAITLAPHLSYLRELWAEIVLARGDSVGAVKILVEAVVQFPEDAYLYYLLASAYRSMGDAPRAVEAIERALILDSVSNVWYWVTAGQIYEWVGQPDKSSFAYRKVLSIGSSVNGAALNAARDGLSRLGLKP